MLQIGNKPIDTMYVGGKLVQQAYLGSTKVYPLHGMIPKAIKDAMVLWYDIKRQGATNESMAKNPILKDLSGNGHDITCYNFAWSGMSGIGGYISNRNVDKWHKPSNNNGTYITKGNTIHISKLNTNKPNYYVTYNGGVANEYIELQGNTYTTKPFNIKISGLPEGKQVKIYGTVGASDPTYNTSFPIQYFNNGTFTVESASCIWNHDIQPIVFNFPSFFIDSDTADDVDITIELLPEYPNALVSDGVDDYASFSLSQNLFNRNTTYIAKYIKISDTGKWQYLFDVSNPDGSTDTDYPNRLYVGNPSNTDNYYGNSNNIIQNDGIVIIGKPKELTYGYTPHFYLFASNSKDNFANAALYSLILFNRTLTAEEIEWVKSNLINGYPTPNVYYDCSLYTNETVDSTNPVLKDLSGHGHDLVLKNFAFAGMSGFGGYVFDDSNLSIPTQYKDAVSIVGNKITLNSKPQDIITTSNAMVNSVAIQGEAGQSVNINIPAFKVKVSGLPDGITLSYNYSISTNSKTSSSWLGYKSFGNGITEIPAINTALTPDSETDYCHCIPYRLMFNTLANEESFSNITIEILPEYENALVFDGVDDYGAGTRDSFDKCTMLMLFKPTEQQDGISVDFRDAYDGDFAIYRNEHAEPYIAYNAINVNGTYINNKLNSTLTITDTMNKKHLITVKGKILNTNDFCVGSNNTHNNYFDRMALYKFLLFDQELTQEQIDKVIQDYHLMDDVDDVWNQ